MSARISRPRRRKLNVWRRKHWKPQLRLHRQEATLGDVTDGEKRLHPRTLARMATSLQKLSLPKRRTLLQTLRTTCRRPPSRTRRMKRLKHDIDLRASLFFSILGLVKERVTVNK